MDRERSARMIVGESYLYRSSAYLILRVNSNGTCQAIWFAWSTDRFGARGYEIVELPSFGGNWSTGMKMTP